MLQIRPLSEIEILSLEKVVKSDAKAHFRNRCQCILLNNRCFTVKDLSRLYQVRTRSIYTWIHNYEHLGIESLNIATGRGIKAKLDTLSEENIKLLKEEIALHPQNLKGVITELSEKFNIDLTIHKLKRYLKKNSSIVIEGFENG
jgi:transposase